MLPAKQSAPEKSQMVSILQITSDLSAQDGASCGSAEGKPGNWQKVDWGWLVELKTILLIVYIVSTFFILFLRLNRKEIIRKNHGAHMPSKTQRDCAADGLE